MFGPLHYVISELYSLSLSLYSAGTTGKPLINFITRRNFLTSARQMTLLTLI